MSTLLISIIYTVIISSFIFKLFLCLKEYLKIWKVIFLEYLKLEKIWPDYQDLI
jgi:hypothetical protein